MYSITHAAINIYIYLFVIMFSDYFNGSISTKVTTNELKNTGIKAIMDEEVENK